jgi:hypothetical protein
MALTAHGVVCAVPGAEEAAKCSPPSEKLLQAVVILHLVSASGEPRLIPLIAFIISARSYHPELPTHIMPSIAQTSSLRGPAALNTRMAAHTARRVRAAFQTTGEP